MTLEDINERLEHLEAVHQLKRDHATQRIMDEAREQARQDALADILEGIATHLGVTRDEFSARYVGLHNLYLEKHLDRARLISGQFAGNIDLRIPEEVYTGDPILPLFRNPT